MSNAKPMTEEEFARLKEAARKLLIKRGFLTPDGRAVERGANLPLER